MELRRVGIFFFLIGFVLLGVFFVSDQSQEPQFGLFLGGVLLVSLGGFLTWRYRTPPAPSGRFGMLKKLRDQPKSKNKK